ncbi:S9 family peptidase [Pendulispora rubella]|uniref:S9 family peptidase n=1 Tax=Pendulispora rubella TaxID=2741070 RepID=A0ABZ2L509_9BACT
MHMPRPLLPLFACALAACASTTPTAPQAPSVEVASPILPEVRAAAAGPHHAFNVDDMLAMERLEQLDVSPDGKLVVFTVSTADVAANRRRTDLWLATVDGASVRRLTTHPEGDFGARFAPDGKSIYFISRRSGSMQVHRLPLEGGEPSQVTSLPVDIDFAIPFPDGKRLLVAMEVYPDAATLEETAKRDEAKAKSPSKVMAFDQAMFRHWDKWDDGKRTHLFVWRPDGPPIDLMKGSPYDAPPGPFGGSEEVTISPDGKTVVFASKQVGREAAWSTNIDIWRVPADGSAAPVSLTAKNPAEDTHPVFSPDGSKVAYLAMTRAGFEADRRRVVLLDWKSGQSKVLTEAWDRSVADLSWSRNGKTLYATADNLGHRSLFAIAPDSGKVTTLVPEGTVADVQVAGDRLVFLRDTLTNPAEIWVSGFDGRTPKAITHFNDARVAAIDWGEPQQFTFDGAKGDKVHAWIVKPHGARGPVPTAMLIHGGPQSSFGNHFHYRWNPQIYAGRGFAAIMIDFHGSTGYGQAFTDAIRNDWGGAPYEDIMKGTDAALAKYPYLDKSRMVALGASYGGFMINWINGNTDRFKALVCHDGNLDETTAYFDTEELWFPEWEHHGTPWDNPEGYSKHSPMKLVNKWKTPTLVIHGGKDFRVVDTQGMSTFTALQRRGIPSRFVYFPDENHWVLKPQNSKRWHEEVLGWIEKYSK